MRARCFALLSVLAIAGCRTPSPPRSAPEVPRQVLFVGNSFTYYNNSVHNHYRAMVRERSDGSAGRVRAMTISGGKLREHREGLRQRLAEQSWHAVVLQGHSNEPIRDRQGFERAAATYGDWVRASGARPVLLMTWAYEGRPDMTAELDDAYCAAAERAGATVAPVGLAFARVGAAHPELGLRIDDGKHPTLVGTYLAACTMFASLRKESPIGLAYAAGLPETVASILQEAAWQTVQEFDARPR